MRVLYMFPGEIVGGAELRTLELCQGLNRLGHNAMIACGQSPCIEMAQRAGIKYHLLPIKTNKLNPWTALRCLASLIRVVRRDRIDIVVTCRRGMALIAHYVTRVTSVPHVYTNVNVFKDKSWLRWTGDFTIAISDAALENAINYLKADPARSKLIHRGVTVPSVLLDRNESRRRLNISEQIPLVGTIGRLVGEKGHCFLLQAMVSVQKRFEDVVLLVIGDGEERQKLEAQKVALGLPRESVVFMGERRDVWDILPALDVCVLASTDKEGLGTALIEAAACGLPLIGTSIGGIPEIIQEGWNGLLVPPSNANALADAVVAVLGNPAQARDMGRRARQMVQEKFSSEREVAQHVGVLEGVLAVARPPSLKATLIAAGLWFLRSIARRKNCQSKIS